MIPLKTVRVLAVPVVLAVGAVTLARCGTPTLVSAPGVVRALGAENQYANVIAQIGGRYVSVRAVMSNPTADPHTYEVSTEVAQLVASAQLVVQNGLGYDAFMTQLESASPNSARQVIDVQSLLGLSSATTNPHLWYQPSNVLRVADAVAKDLTTLEPRHRGYFSTRLAAFTKSFAPLRAAIRSFRASFGGVHVATTEPVADYLLSDLGLVNATPFRFQGDIMNGIDPAPEDLALEQRLLSRHQVRVFCFNAQVSGPVTQSLRSLAEASHVPVVAFYETMPGPRYNYQSWMLSEIAALTRALVHATSTMKL